MSGKSLGHAPFGPAAREDSDVLRPASLPDHVIQGRPPAAEGAAEDFEPRKLAEVERDHVDRMMRYCGGDREKAAAELGIPVERVDEILGSSGSSGGEIP